MLDSKVSANAEIYTNFEGLANLRREAEQNNPEAVEKVARQFEGIFVQMMLKSMRDTVPDGGLFRKDGMEFYQDMHDKQLSLHLSEGEGLGLREVIMRQLSAAQDNTDTGRSEGLDVQDYLASPLDSRFSKNADVHQYLQEALKKRLVNSEEKTETSIQSKEEFIERLWPSAENAAQKLGVDPQILIAQAALESGWGQSTIFTSSGENSHNLFGIKASAQWQGDSVSIDTLEYHQGIPEKQKASFRSYESYEDSFNDYAEFINDNPRYSLALEVAQDADKYIRELQNAGYATDPDYAKKVMSIYRQLQDSPSTVSDERSDSQRTVLSDELDNRGDVDV